MVEGLSLARISEEPRLVYERMKQQLAGPRKAKRHRVIDSEAFTAGRDPLPVADVFGEVSENFGWDAPLAQAQLFVEWARLVGEGVAEHAIPVSLLDGKLTIQASSSAWATQLRIIRHELLTTLAEKSPDVSIDTIVVLAPGAPSWKKGSRSVLGRGPRDTYG